jgi:hypothetical protein
MTDAGELTPQGSKFSQFMGRAFSSTHFTSRLLVLWTGSFLLFVGIAFSGIIELSKRLLLPNALQLMDQSLEISALKLRSDFDANISKSMELSEEGFAFVPKQIGLPRMPKGSEIFVWKESEKVNFVTSGGNETMRTGKWTVPEYIQKMDEKSSVTLVTSFGEVIWTNTAKTDLERIRKEMASLFRSGLLQASRLNKKEDGLRGYFSKVSFYESVQNVRDTNLFIYRSTPIPAIMSPIFIFLGRIFSLLFAASLVCGMLSWMALNGFFHPIRTLSSWSKAVVRGGKPLPPPRMPHWSLTAESKEQMMILLQATQELQRVRLLSAQWQKVWGGMVETGDRMIDAKSTEYAKQVMHSYLSEVSQFDKQVAERSFQFLNRVESATNVIAGIEKNAAIQKVETKVQQTPPKLPTPSKSLPPQKHTEIKKIETVAKQSEVEDDEAKTVVASGQATNAEPEEFATLIVEQTKRTS